MLKKIIKIFAAAVLLAAADITFEINFPAVREVVINTDKLEKGRVINLLQISDVHDRNSIALTDRVVKKARKLKPDVIVITGDLVDASTESYENVYSFIKKLSEICPRIYFVSGNHEWSNRVRRQIIKELQDLGVRIINNRGGSISIRVIDNLEGLSPDLILSGHTHGGQVRLPFIGAVIEPGEGLFPELDKGKFKVGGGTLLYIDNGVGTSTLPLRFLNRSQVSMIRISGNGQ